MKPPAPDLPNFASWGIANLVNFCTDAYIRMQEQAAELEQSRLDTKNAFEMTRKLIKEIECLEERSGKRTE